MSGHNLRGNALSIVPDGVSADNQLGIKGEKCNANRIIYFSCVLRLEDLRAKLNRFPRTETTVELVVSR